MLNLLEQRTVDVSKSYLRDLANTMKTAAIELSAHKRAIRTRHPIPISTVTKRVLQFNGHKLQSNFHQVFVKVHGTKQYRVVKVFRFVTIVVLIGHLQSFPELFYC